MNYSYILVVLVLLVSTSSESTENKNVWYPIINKEINSENNKGLSNAYLPPVQQQSAPSGNNIYSTYPAVQANIPPAANVPQQQYYYYPVHTYTQQPNFVAPQPVYPYNQQQNFAASHPLHTYSQEPNFVAPVTAPSLKYLPIAPQYNHYTQPFMSQMNQVVQKPETLLSIPYDMGMKGLGFMSKVLTNVHQGIDSFTGFLQPPPLQSGYGFVPGYEAQKNVPLNYGYGNRNWQVETPAYSHGVYGGYDSNLGKNYDSLYYPGKGSISGYNNMNGNGYPAWNVPNYAEHHGNYYYVH